MSNEANVPGNNGTVLNTVHIIKHVMSSATESELAAVYIMAKEAVYIRIILEEMGQKTPTPTANRQRDIRCSVQWQDSTKAHKGNEHAVLPVERQRVPETIQNIPETRKVKLCRLLDKVSHGSTPQIGQERIHNTNNSGRNAED